MQRPLPKPNEVYRHFKGKLYLIITIAALKCQQFKLEVAACLRFQKQAATVRDIFSKASSGLYFCEQRFLQCLGKVDLFFLCRDV